MAELVASGRPLVIRANLHYKPPAKAAGAERARSCSGNRSSVRRRSSPSRDSESTLAWLECDDLGEDLARQEAAELPGGRSSFDRNCPGVRFSSLATL